MTKNNKTNLNNISTPPNVSSVHSRQSVAISSGPIPPASELQLYEQTHPGLADRIFTMAENQSKHRITMENETIHYQNIQSSRGQIFAFVIAMTALLGSFYCFSLGYEWGGSIVSGVTLTSLVSAFIAGKKNQRKNLDSKTNKSNQ